MRRFANSDRIGQASDPTMPSNLLIDSQDQPSLSPSATMEGMEIASLPANWRSVVRSLVNCDRNIGGNSFNTNLPSTSMTRFVPVAKGERTFAEMFSDLAIARAAGSQQLGVDRPRTKSASLAI